MLDLLLILHVLLFVYWLGADLGVFYSSRYVMRADLGVEARMTALKIMAFMDLAPRVCLILFLPSGVSLMAYNPIGEPIFGGWRLVVVWVVGLLWLAVFLGAHHFGGSGRGLQLTRLDLVIRAGAVVVLLGVSIYTLATAHPFGVDTNPKWLGAKVGCYALAIACGLAIRYRLRPFEPALGALLAEGSTPQTEQQLTGSIRRTEPFVLAIWVLIITAAVLGIAQPGTTYSG